MPDRPLISFVLISYNQERFIREAVAGAFSQTYSPLEIVICDDCSPDHTFEIIKEMAAAYRGLHRTILHRNHRNLGICANLNKAVELSNGELIVTGAGDDVSLPHRCERIADEWMKPGRQWHSVVSDAEIIDECAQKHGVYQNIQTPYTITSLETVLSSGIVGVAGCCHAFSRANYTLFGPIPSEAPGEDEILGFRSLIMGGVQWIPDVLLLYRRHDGCTYRDVATLKKMRRPERLRTIKEDERACALRYRLYTDYINAAVKNSILTKEQANKYSLLLCHHYPYHQYRIVCKYSFLYSATWLSWMTITGNYRKGMFALFKCSHIRCGIRSTVRRWLVARQSTRSS